MIFKSQELCLACRRALCDLKIGERQGVKIIALMVAGVGQGQVSALKLDFPVGFAPNNRQNREETSKIPSRNSQVATATFNPRNASTNMRKKVNRMVITDFLAVEWV